MRKFRRYKFKREMRRRPINVLASLITALSLYFGLVSIFLSIREDYEWAAFAIFAAVVCDMLDGTVARITKSVSDFGKEFDSLCDLVSFGVAPAVLIYHAYWREEQMAGTPEGRTGAIIAIIFVVLGALRLARYNVYQSTQRESFTGLPIPAAGGTIAAFVLFSMYWELNVAFWVLGPLTLILAVLMVSTVRYPKDRLKRAFVVSPRNAFRMLALSGIALAILHYAVTHSPAIVLFPFFMGYVVFGLYDDFLSRLRGRRPAPAGPAALEGSPRPESPPSADRGALPDTPAAESAEVNSEEER
jgi:CDP-diacylglycerol--serine O-phosphatidyltransferase